MPSQTNGFGTTYYGASDPQQDGSFVTTEWFILFNVPLIPLHSWRVHYKGEMKQGTRTTNLYDVVSQVSLDKKHILEAYAWLIIPIVLLTLFVGALGSSSADTAATVFTVAVTAGIGFWVVIFPLCYKAKTPDIKPKPRSYTAPPRPIETKPKRLTPSKTVRKKGVSSEQLCPYCDNPTHIDEEGNKKFEICDECGWSKVVSQ